MDPLAAGSEVTRPTFWRIDHLGEALFYYLAAVSIAIFFFGIYDRLSHYASGTDDPFDRLDTLPRRIVGAAKIVGTNELQFDRDWYAGIMHTFVMWGFLTLLIATAILAVDIDLYRPLVGESFFVGDFYLAYSLVVDALGLLFVVGIGMALYRRYWVRNTRLWGAHTSLEDDLFIWSLFVLGVGGYLLEGIRILAQGFPAFETVSFVGWFVADMLSLAGVSPATAGAAYAPVWWSHAVIALLFVAAIPYAKPLHMLSSFANVVTRDPRSGVRLPRVPADATPEEIGPSDLTDFSWKQLLDHDACTKCGRCSAVCPAKAAGRPLDPRDVILDLKAYGDDVASGGENRPIIADGGGVIDARTMESCMSCLACVDSCPVEIEHVTQFTEMNRRLTESGQMDQHVQERMMDIFQHGNAFGEPERRRPDWTEELPFDVPDARGTSVEYLWYVGDYPSYDERNRSVARALARIFEAADVSYGILYESEQNDGNDVRRVGEEGLYEMLAEENIEAFETGEFERIVCTDPHSYNTFRNEYDQFGFENGDDVYHYTQMIEELVMSGELDLDGLAYTVTYHDPCHLGRFNGEYEAPRAVIEATGCELREMPRNRQDSFCCGGGGGGIWMDFDEDPKPSEERLREATEDVEDGSDVEKFVVACPQCMTMYEDGRKTGGYEDEVEIVDVAELVAEAIEAADDRTA